MPRSIKTQVNPIVFNWLRKRFSWSVEGIREKLEIKMEVWRGEMIDADFIEVD